MDLRIDKGKKGKTIKKLFCMWCGHTQLYEVGKYDQVRCGKCLRFIKKK